MKTEVYIAAEENLGKWHSAYLAKVAKDLSENPLQISNNYLNGDEDRIQRYSSVLHSISNLRCDLQKRVAQLQGVKWNMCVKIIETKKTVQDLENLINTWISANEDITIHSISNSKYADDRCCAILYTHSPKVES